jgi:cardiolipin synthase (CMP-forming)
MLQSTRLLISIIATLAAYCLIQFGIFIGFVLSHGITGIIIPLFSAFNLVLHLVLILFLSAQRPLFRFTHSGEPLSKVNLANRITLFRISSLPTIISLLILARSYPVMELLLAFTVVVFLTDMLDGAVARAFNQTTEIGRFLDSMSDYGILILISCAMVAFALIPIWFFGLIIVRLLIQSIGAVTLFFCQGFILPSTTLLGKLSIFSIMSVYALELLAIVVGKTPGFATAVFVSEIVASLVVVISIVEKSRLLAESFQEFFRTRRIS